MSIRERSDELGLEAGAICVNKTEIGDDYGSRELRAFFGYVTSIVGELWLGFVYVLSCSMFGKIP